MSREKDFPSPRLPSTLRGERQKRPSAPCASRTARQPSSSPDAHNRPLNSVVSPSSQASLDGNSPHSGASARHHASRSASSVSLTSALALPSSELSATQPASVIPTATSQAFLWFSPARPRTLAPRV